MTTQKTCLSITILMVCIAAQAEHSVLVQGNDILAKVNAQGKIEWQMEWGGIHDVHLLDNGNILTVERNQKIVEIDPKTKEVVWEYSSRTGNGNRGQRVEVHAIQPLPNGNVMIAESGPGRIIEIDRDGKLLKSTALKLENPNAHRDTRLARKLKNGNYLVCHEGDSTVREYDGSNGNVVWEFPVPMFGKEPKPGHGPEAFGNHVFSAIRLDNGNTLIGTGDGHSILEVTPAKEIIWQIHQNDLPGITLAWVTTLEKLSNGNLVIGNCHAGPGQPLLVEIDSKTKKVLWTFDHFDTFGNAVSNSLLLDQANRTIR